MLESLKKAYSGFIDFLFSSSDREIQDFIDKKESELPKTGNPKDDNLAECAIYFNSKTFQANRKIRRQVCRVAANRYRGNARCDGGECD